MSYTTQAKIEALIPRRYLTQAFDVNGEGQIEAVTFAALLAHVDDEINGTVGPAVDYAALTAVPPVLTAAATVLACELIYARSGVAGDGNPWADKATDMRAMLGKIGSGTLAITAYDYVVGSVADPESEFTPDDEDGF